MPGVPSGRGCEACRKQKKRCDQGKPVCSRCTRLGISCIGSGKQRFKFVEQQAGTAKPIRAAHAVQILTIGGISVVPCNQTMMIAGALCSALEVKDVRYDLSVYGEFLQHIPRRLGTNKALDASVKALTTSFASVPSRKRSIEGYETYVQGLQALRVCLGDPKEVGSPDTLCAVYLMMLCQGWIGQRDDCTGHGEALAHLLNVASTQTWEGGTFEAEPIVTLCAPVIVESIGNPKMNLYPWLTKLTETHDSSIPMESIKLRNLAKLPDFINNPEANLLEITYAYQRLGIDVPKVRKHLSNISEKGEPLRNTHARYQTVYSILLAYSIVMNTILRSFGAGNIILAQELAAMVDEMIAIAEDASQYRPLGASGVPLFLVTALVATNDKFKRVKIEEILADYQTDFAIASWMEIALWLDAKLHNYSQPRLIQLEGRLDSGNPLVSSKSDSDDLDTDGKPVEPNAVAPCCVM
ncbi:hypothetical protein BDZ45DRAFT_810934 [Acephala macrosclerotiorum]|nr:hypothetical protein BDZ45DRAFT_810934 [Acephala macrosclerotiorum]